MHTASLVKPVLPNEREISLWHDVKGWLLDTHPCALARRHLSLALLWLTLGLLSALLLRFELMTPGLDAMQARSFGVLLSLHGFLMFYFVALPAFPGILGHLALAGWMPEGRLVFPRLGVLSWHLLAAGGALVVGGFWVGGTEVGWSFDAGFGGRFNQPGTVPAALGVLLASVSLGLMGLNTLSSLRVLRRTGMPAGGARILAEAIGCGSLLAVVVAPLLGVAMVLVLADAWFNLAVFAPAMGGDPQSFVVLFRLFSGPAQNMMLLLALGNALSVVAERTRVASFSRGQLYGFVLMLVASLGGWGAELWSAESGQPVTILGGHPLNLLLFAAFLFSLVFVLRFLRSGVTRVDTALVYALGFFITAAHGLGVGLLLATPVGSAQFGNTQLASAQMHLMMMAVLGMGLLGGLHAGWTALTGRSFSDPLGRFLAFLVVVGTQLCFGPLLVLGLRGVSFRANAYPPEFQLWHVMSTAGATVLVVALVLALINLAAGRKAVS